MVESGGTGRLMRPFILGRDKGNDELGKEPPQPQIEEPLNGRTWVQCIQRSPINMASNGLWHCLNEEPILREDPGRGGDGQVGFDVSACEPASRNGHRVLSRSLLFKLTKHIRYRERDTNEFIQRWIR